MSSWTIRRIVHSETWRSFDMALMDFEGSSSIMPWTCCTKCDALILSKRASCFLRSTTLSTLSSTDASNSQRTLWPNDRATFKNWKISRSLWFACIAMTQRVFSFYESIYCPPFMTWKEKKRKKTCCENLAGTYVSVLKYLMHPIASYISIKENSPLCPKCSIWH